jgi:hypothetical protein
MVDERAAEGAMTTDCGVLPGVKEPPSIGGEEAL